MMFVSTRARTPPTPDAATTIDAALVAGLAPDGGLYVPERIPACDIEAGDTLAQTAHSLLAPYFAQSSLRDALPSICAHAYSFEAPLRAMTGHGDHLLELFHGPTAAFKDYAARFLAEALSRLRPVDAAPPTTIIVATSGDTGAAVASAFHRRDGFNVVILYPKGRVSPRQAHGLECWGDNVRTFRVHGTFDDCQRLAKQALSDETLRREVPLSSANSISLGRLLPQTAYYAHAALRFHREHGQPLNLIVPTGNLGNACAAFLARRMLARGTPSRGMESPIGELVLACNANDVLPRYFAGEAYEPRATKATLANAMDVGAPSNFERLRHWHASDDELRASLRAFTVDDASITDVVRRSPERHGVVADPHTAAGLHVLERIRKTGDMRPWAVVATAHPAKFDTIVEPLIGHSVAMPPALAQCLSRPASASELPADYDALRAELRA